MISNVMEIIKELERLYPDAKAQLDFTNPFELLVATVLSAQCTDVRVNIITKELFKTAPTPEKMVSLGEAGIKRIIRSCGMYNQKAASLMGLSRMLVENFNSQVPTTHEEIMTLPGVGRKTANVVLSNAYGVDAIAVDTHVFRVSNRLGLADASTVEATESQLMQAIPKSKWTKAHHMIIYHGRQVCSARSPKCESCTLSGLCRYYREKTGG